MATHLKRLFVEDDDGPACAENIVISASAVFL